MGGRESKAGHGLGHALGHGHGHGENPSVQVSEEWSVREVKAQACHVIVFHSSPFFTTVHAAESATRARARSLTFLHPSLLHSSPFFILPLGRMRALTFEERATWQNSQGLNARPSRSTW